MVSQIEVPTNTLYDQDYYLWIKTTINQCLKPYILEIFDECHNDARKEVSQRSQLSLDTFPVIPIGSLAQVLDEDWFPEY